MRSETILALAAAAFVGLCPTGNAATQSNDLPEGFKASGFPTKGVKFPSSEKPSGEGKSSGKRPKTTRPRDLSALVKGAAADLAV